MRVVVAFAVLLGGFAAPVVARTYLAVPSVDWNALAPYVRANIVAFLNEDKFEVFICSGQTDRGAVGSYDEAVGDFVKALVYQLAMDDRRFNRAVDEVGAEFRQRVPSLTPMERQQFRELYWQSLSRSPDILPRIQREFASAQKQGRLRCWVCDKDSTLYPAAVRWRR